MTRSESRNKGVVSRHHRINNLATPPFLALLFAAGVINLLCVAVIALFVLAEKSLPRGELLGRVTGVALVVAGVVLMARVW